MTFMLSALFLLVQIVAEDIGIVVQIFVFLGIAIIIDHFPDAECTDINSHHSCTRSSLHTNVAFSLILPSTAPP
jgi:hypothetical protein